MIVKSKCAKSLQGHIPGDFKAFFTALTPTVVENAKVFTESQVRNHLSQVCSFAFKLILESFF